MKKIIVAGASGFLGRHLSRYFNQRGWDVVGFARRKSGIGEHCRFVEWDGKSMADWAEELNGSDVLVNLAGRSVNCRYNAANKREILDSRLQSTNVLGRAISDCDDPPELWMNSSMATIYRHADDRPQSDIGELGEGFSAETAKAWESAFFGSRVSGRVRKVALRTAMVLGDERGSVFRYLLNLAKIGFGGRVGSGKQMVSWVHVDDYCRAADWLTEHDEISGPINITSPDPICNAELMSKIRKYTRMPIGLPANKWLAEVVAYLSRTDAELILKSLWVVPTRLEEYGFVFKHPEIDIASLCSVPVNLPSALHSV